MVKWYDPGQLIKTAQQVIVSTLFGRYSDPRLVESVAINTAGDCYDYTKDENGREREEIWIDYVSDTGDGWNSTYAVAYWVTRPILAVSAPENGASRFQTRPGAILVFGGDEGYPAGPVHWFRFNTTVSVATQAASGGWRVGERLTVSEPDSGSGPGSSPAGRGSRPRSNTELFRVKTSREMVAHRNGCAAWIRHRRSPSRVFQTSSRPNGAR